MANVALRSALIQALANPNVQAGLCVVRVGETSLKPDAYRTIVGGELFYPGDKWEHPRKAVKTKWGWSSAAGAYQFMAFVPEKVKTDTWDWCVAKYGFEDFSPAMQDLAAVALMDRRGALEPLKAGRFHEALRLLGKEWASLPGSPYGQPTLTLDRARAVYLEAGGTITDEPQQKPPEVKPVAPIVIPLLEVLSGLIPQLGKLFGSGSDVSNRNVAAATLAADAIVKVTNSVNLQEAVERVQEDPDALNAAREVVAKLVMEIGEAGGGGINGARTFNSADGSPPLYRRGDFWFSLLLFTIPLLLVLDVVYFHPQLWGNDARTQTLTAGLNLLSFIGGYWLGSTIQSARKTEILAAKGQPA